MTFYHGTSGTFGILTRILPPDLTGIERELRNKKRTDMVYISTSALSAANYAKKAASKFGGKPILYIVAPIGNHFPLTNGEWLTESAKVIKYEEVY